jgi:hypothetical protein
LTGASSTALAKITEFQIIGDSGAGGTINWMNMPVGSDELQFVSAQTAGLTINNAPATFTLDAGHFAAPFAGGDVVNFAGTALTNSFALILGDATGADTYPANAFGNLLTVNGAGIVDIVANAPAGATNDSLDFFSAANTFTANPGGGVALTVGGDASLDSNPLFFVGSGGSSITATLAGTIELDAWSGRAGSDALGWNPAAGVTNASTINAFTSGGLWMAAADVGNSGTTGVLISGSATHSNALAGSAGNDAIRGGTGGDVIITEGGSDLIFLGAPGGAHDNVDLYTGSTTADVFAPLGFDAAGNYIGNGGGIVAGATDTAQGGFWGAAPGTTVDLTAEPTGFGTSADMSVVNNFTAGSGAGFDTLNFSVGSWSFGLTSLGLVNAGGNAILPSATVVIGTQSAGSTVASNVNLIELTDHTFANAAALATALGDAAGGGSEPLHLTDGSPNDPNEHLLVAYSDGSNVRIADVDIAIGFSPDTAQDTVIASDMVQLVGVASVTSFVASNAHFTA